MFHIYVDGSCLGNQNVDSETPAGWGVVVITGSNDLGRGNGEIFHEFNGKVITDQSDSKFIGAEVGSNNTAELTAFAEACLLYTSPSPRDLSTSRMPSSA